MKRNTPLSHSTQGRRDLRVIGIWIAVGLLILLFYSEILPWDLPWLACPLYTTTSIQCPFCGSQRALASLLQGHLAEAMRFNGLLLTVWPLALVAYLGRKHLLNDRVRSGAWWILLVIVLAYTIARNLPWEIFDILRPI